MMKQELPVGGIDSIPPQEDTPHPVSYNCEEYHEIEKCHSAISSLWRFSLYTEKTQARRTRVKPNREKDHDEQIAIDDTSLGPVGGFHEWAG